MRLKNFLSGLLVSGLLCVPILALAVDSWPDFSADVQQKAGGQTMQGKVYISGQKNRMEMATQTIIVRGDRNLSWILMPQNMYMENSLDALSDASMMQQAQGEVERVSEGHEKIGDQDTEKFRITSETPKGRSVIYHWLRKDGIPAKVEAGDGSWGMEYLNIKKGSQDAALFEIPAGYQKMELGINMKDLLASMESMKGEIPS